ncbi:hypothetical protein [Acinetobacter guillouiae]|uniref:hypothetical protein n=1 Tax=Acinetobacter guillouiae TaxID=106649 RepID=UPI003AF83CDE
MTVAGNPGVFLILIFYFFIIQSVIVVYGFIFKLNRSKVLNLNILIGFIPCFIVFLILLDHIENDFWISWDSIFLYLLLCWLLNILLLSLDIILKIDLVKYRWYFFVYINVVGGFLLSFLLND